MSVTSANVEDLGSFVRGSRSRVDRLTTDVNAITTKANAVMGACGGSQYPSTPSISALGSLVTAWTENHEFVRVVRDDLVEADQYDADGNAVVSDAVIRTSLRTAGLDQAPNLVEVAAIELYGQPPYSGFVDDPICLANGNFLLRDGDLELFGVASCLSVVRTYNSRDERAGAFGPGWSSLLDVSLDVTEARATWRGPDGGGVELRRTADGGWAPDRRRRISMVVDGEGWRVVQGHDRSWAFDAGGVLTSFTAVGAEVVVERSDGDVRFVDGTSGRWVRYELGTGGEVRSAHSSDGREVRYERDATGRVTIVRRDRGAVSYEHDAAGFVSAVVDADGIVVCRNEYDPEGRVLVQVEHHGRETRYEYRRDGVATVTASDGAPPNVMVHDRRGRLTAMIDGLGNAMRLAYGDLDEVVQIVDRTGATTRFEHDERGNVLVRTDPDGLQHRYAWDDLDRLVEETDRAGATTRYAYEGTGRDATTIVQADGSEVHATYDDHGLPTSVVDADGVSASLRWRRDGLLEQVADGMGAAIAFAYDEAGRSVGVVAPDGRPAEVDLDAGGRVLALRTGEGERTFAVSAAGRTTGGTDASGRPWEGVLDHAGDLVELSDPAGRVVAFERDLIGQITATVAADGAIATFEHDPVGRRTAAVDPLGNRTEVHHDPEGRPLQVVDPAGRVASRELDVLGRTTTAVGYGGATSLRTYHPEGQLASVSDASGAEWAYEVDPLGRVVASTDPLGATTTYRYTPGGRLAEVVSPLGRTVQRRYDAAGRLASIVEPDGTEVTFERRADGAVDRVVRAGVVTTFDYDESGRASAIAGPWGSVATTREGSTLAGVVRRGAGSTFEHDPRGLLARAVDPAGVVTEFVHDRCGRLLSHETGEVGASYTWDAAGRLASATDAHGHETTFDRDPRGALERIVRPDGSGTVRTFGDDGQLSGAVDLDGEQLLEVERDANGAVVAARAGDAELRATYDPVGRLTSFATAAGTVRWAWDADGDLERFGDDGGLSVEVVRGDGGAVQGFALGDGAVVAAPAAPVVERDEVRRVVVDEDGRRYAYDLAGRLFSATVDGRRTTYAYDDLGMLSTERSDDGVRTYRYGRAGELVSLRDEHGIETTFEHDATGRRTAELRSDGTATRYAWDAFGRLASVVRTAADGTAEVHRIEHDPTGRPSAVDGTPVLWDHAVTGSLLGIGDERFLRWGGQVRVVDDPDAAWSRRLADDPWGVDGGRGLRLGYRGELALDDLVFLGARVYDARTRSFLSRDPLPSVPGQLGYAGAYGYAWCDPVNLVDPSGLRPLSDEEYDAFREQASKGIFRKAWDAVAEDPWKFIAKAAIVVGSIAVMAVATATLGPVGLIVAGAVVGALSNGLNTAIDGGDWGDVGRSALIGGLFGAATGGLSRFIPPSTAGTLGQRVTENGLRNGLLEYPMAFTQEGVDSYLPGGDGRYDVGNALLNGTTGTVAGVGGGELDRLLTPNLSGAFDGETPSSLLPDPARNTVLDINTASSSDLQRVHGIGPTLADRIVQQREAAGGFGSTQDLLDIDGIGPARLEAINSAGGIAQ